MITKGKRILAAVLLAVLFSMLFTAPASAERYRFQSRSVKILRDMTGMLKKENLKQTAERQKKLAADLEKIRKIERHIFNIAERAGDFYGKLPDVG